MINAKVEGSLSQFPVISLKVKTLLDISIPEVDYVNFCTYIKFQCVNLKYKNSIAKRRKVFITVKNTYNLKKDINIFF